MWILPGGGVGVNPPGDGVGINPTGELLLKFLQGFKSVILYKEMY